MSLVKRPKRIRKQASSWLIAALLSVPLAMIVAKLPLFPTSRWMNHVFSLSDLSPALRSHAELVLFVPVAAIVVCLFRLTLGLPVLSLFRPILTAVGFHIIGIPLGLAFLLLVLASVVLIRPLLRQGHYYVRVPIMLSLTAAWLVVPLMMYRWWHADTLRHLAYFPIISLALMAESFTKKLNKRGLRSAMWPTINAIIVAVIITLLAGIPGALQVVLDHPEALLLQAGIVLLIGKYLDLRLFKGKNPFKPKAPPATGAPQLGAPANLQLVGE
jgi:7 transmembrane helices usually fused to an inactive transglutaminase